MVRFNVQTLADREVQTSDASVKKYDLPTKGSLSWIRLVIRASNGATSNHDNWIPEAINKIQVVANGDQVVWSLTGEEAFRHGWLKLGKPPYNLFSEVAGAVQECEFPILFGRYENDPLYGIDLAKYKSLQLVIDYALTNGGAIAATTYATGTFEISAIMGITPPDRLASFRGFIGTREIQNYTSLASSDSITKLPGNFPMTAFCLYAKEEGVAPTANVTHLWLQLDSGQKKPIYGRYDFFLAAQIDKLGYQPITYHLLASTTDTKHPMMYPIRTVNFNTLGIDWATGATNGVVNLNNCSLSVDTVTLQGMKITYDKGGVVSSAIAVTAHETCQMVVHGHPGNMLRIDLGDPESFDGALLPGEQDTGAIGFTNGNAGAYVGIIVEELRS
jgi:hypothetical protein